MSRSTVGRALAAASAAAVLGGLFWPVAAGAWLLALGAVTLPVGLVALATDRPGRPSPPSGALAAIWALLAGSAAGLLALGGAPAAAASPAGLPAATWVLLLGLGVAPLVLVCWLYVASFDGSGLSAADLERLRRPRPPQGPRPADDRP